MGDFVYYLFVYLLHCVYGKVRPCLLKILDVPSDILTTIAAHSLGLLQIPIT